MSEKIYAWLLRLYPARFREAYGEEALQLIRDRARDEKGFFPGLRLWLDLLADWALSVARGFRPAQPELISATVQPHLEGMPSFHVLGGQAPRRGSMLLGSVLSLGTLATFPALINHFGNDRRPATASIQTQGPAGLPQPPAPPSSLQDAPRATARAAVGKGNLDSTERRRIIDAAISNLKEHYIDPSVAQKMADALLARQESGDYDAVTDAAAFADRLTRQLRDVSRDMHLDVVYSRDPLPERPPASTPEYNARYRKALEQENCTFEKVEILPHNIGYIKLNSFPDPSFCRTTAVNAMSSVNQADAVIFDLRDNRGGYPDMVMLIAAYLFDHPEYMYNPRENTSEQSWTRSPVPGNHLAGKPVYVLTSARTISGAEHFSYDLKMLKRATLVGETTGGLAHAGVFYRMDDHFGMGIPEVKPINPFSQADWEGVGVEPDVKVKSVDALDAAEKLAAGHAASKRPLSH